MPVAVSLYEEKDTFLDRLDPRLKIFWVLTCFAISMLFNHPLYMFVLVFHIFIIAILGKLSKGAYILISGAIILTTVISLLLWPRNIPEGNVLFMLFGRNYTDVGIMFALAMGMRVTSMISAAIVWLFSTSPQKLSLALTKMGFPAKVGLGISVVLRFIPYIVSEFQTIAETQMARGSDFKKGSKLSQIKKYVPLFGPLFTRMFLLINSLALALEARGFGISNKPTSLYDLEFDLNDYVFGGFTLLALIISVSLRVIGLGRVVTYLV